MEWNLVPAIDIFAMMKPVATGIGEEPPFIGDWYRERKLGTGGFGVVSLWKNKKTNQSVGKEYRICVYKNPIYNPLIV